MELYFTDDVKAFRKVLDAGCGCLNCNGGDEECLMFKQASRSQVKDAYRTADAVKSIEGPSEEWTEKQLNEIAMKLVAATAPINAKHPKNSNRVFLNEHDIEPLSPYALSAIAKCHTTAEDYKAGGRLDGNLCFCNGNGEFVICDDNEEGDKVYMQCRKCGGYSHL